jgi:hypothetical protein
MILSAGAEGVGLFIAYISEQEDGHEDENADNGDAAIFDHPDKQIICALMLGIVHILVALRHVH